MTNEGLFLRYTLIASHPAIRHIMFIPFCLRLYLALRVVTRILGHYSLGMLGLLYHFVHVDTSDLLSYFAADQIYVSCLTL